MLSIEDRLQIQALYARYCATFDLGDAQGWVNCFTPEAVFVGATENRGHAQLRAFVDGRIASRAQAPNKNVQHWNANLIVEGDGDKAKGMCYILLVGRSKATQEIVFQTQGTYVDELVKNGGQWRFASRRMTPDHPKPDAIPRPA